MKEVKIKIAGKQYKVEVAETEDEHEVGLQNRTELASDKGMLFIFEDEENRSFWMKDTPLPLDIIFIDEDLIVTVVHKGEPNSEEMLDGICTYVLELNQNSGVQVGDELEFESETESEKIQKMLVLNSKGNIQMELNGGERIVSRKETKVLIRKAKKANALDNEGSYKSLGKYMFKVLDGQEQREPEYVKSKNDNENE